ncbi:MAG: diguanylate cyclase [Anaerocolumna sp.]|jgi:diguanylate cyclase (GGDEF)-like protein|nr:diguanylate cyclase [Anaerocolumna sp.]
MKSYLQKEINEKLKNAKELATMNPDKSYTLCKEAYQVSKKNSLKLEEGYALIGMALACRAKSENNKMLDYAYSALEIFEESQDTLGKVRSVNLIGIAYFYSSMYEQALKYLKQAVDLLLGCKDNYLLSCVFNNIGEVFRESVKFDAAIEYYKKALRLSIESDSKINTASILSNIGEIYFLEKKYTEAKEYFIKSYDILINENDMVALSEVENRLGNIYYINQNYSMAAEYFTTALQKIDSIDNKFYAIDILMNIAKLQFENDKKTSFSYLEKAKQYAKESKTKKKISMVYKTAADYHEITGDYENALKCFKKYHGMEQEISALLVGNKLEILKIELEHLNGDHNFEQAGMMNQRLEMEITYQRHELEKIQKINKMLEEKVFEDELTQVPNRRYINNLLNKTWEDSSQENQRIALFIIDIDNFKKYNDYWGHPEGDKCLIKVANCLKEIQVMRNDVFGRYGGEEFMYFVKNLDYDQALELGNLLRIQVEKLDLYYLYENKNYVLTISVGGAFGNLSSFDSVANIIQIADKELYRSKNMGRNITFVNNRIK